MAQFIVKPPLSIAGSVFKAATGRELTAGVSWVEFIPVSDEVLETVRPYFRPCHQDILDRTLAGGTPLTLLRQLLRPHRLRIETVSKGWRVYDPAQPCVAHSNGTTISWD